MGWKNVKEHYKIEHTVMVENGTVCIGSGYVHDLATICLQTGMVTENRTFSSFLKDHYPQLINVPVEEVLSLINAPDSFSNSLPVYTWDGGEILEKQCEEYGYPNVTHDGMVMYENKFSPDKRTAIERAKKDAIAGVRILNDQLLQAEIKVFGCRSRLQFEIDQRDRLDVDYPDVVIAEEGNA